MKKIIILTLSALILTACNDANQPIVNSNTTKTTPPQNSNNLTVVSSHSNPTPAANTTAPASADSTSSTTSPMSKPVDVSALTTKIEQSEKEYKAKPTDAKAKENLAKAYFDRAFVLTEAAQYRAALGDFRKGLKLNPNDQKAKEMHDQIIDIFKSIGREPPKEGEEPPPAPVEKK